jgi:hypothetical protein
MKKIFILFLVIIVNILNYSIHAQVNVTLLGQKTLGGNSPDFGVVIKKTNDGGYILGGTSISGISGDKNEICRGGSDYWVIKINPGFSIQWQKTIGGNSEDILSDIICLDDGGFFILGTSSSPISGDKTIDTIGGYDYWCLRLDSAGSIVWQNSFGGSMSDTDPQGVLLYNGSIIIAGQSNSDSSGCKNENSRGSYDYWIVSLDSSFAIKWQRTIGGTGVENRPKIKQVANNRILIFGTSGSPVSGEKSEPAFGGMDYWILQIDTSGIIEWDKTYGGDDWDEISCNSMISMGDYYYFAGGSISGVSGLKTESCRGASDFWIIKVGYDGSIIWDKTIGGNAGDSPSSLGITSDNQIIIVGTSNSGVSGEKSEPSFGLADYWFVSLDTLGNLNYQKTLGGDNNDYCSDNIIVGDDHFIMLGSSLSGISGLKTENCRGQSDYWLIEVASNFGLYNKDILTQFFCYPNPSNDIFNIVSSSDKSIFYRVYNTLGSVILLGNFINNTTIDLSNFESGPYLIVFFDGEEIWCEKLITN